MTTNGLPDTRGGPLHWGLHHGLIIVGIDLFWFGIAAALTGLYGVIRAGTVLIAPYRTTPT